MQKFIVVLLISLQHICTQAAQTDNQSEAQKYFEMDSDVAIERGLSPCNWNAIGINDRRVSYKFSDAENPRYIWINIEQSLYDSQDMFDQAALSYRYYFSDQYQIKNSELASMLALLGDLKEFNEASPNFSNIIANFKRKFPACKYIFLCAPEYLCLSSILDTQLFDTNIIRLLNKKHDTEAMIEIDCIFKYGSTCVLDVIEIVIIIEFELLEAGIGKQQKH